MARGPLPKPKEKQPISWWILLLVGTPIVLLLSIFTGRKLANALVGSGPKPKVRPAASLDPSTMDEVGGEDPQPADNFYAESSPSNEDPREAAQRAIDAVRARRGNPSGGTTTEESPNEPRQRGLADEKKEDSPQDEVTTDTEGFDENLDVDTIRETDRALETDDLVEDGDFPSAMPPGTYRDKTTSPNSGASAPAPGYKPAPKDDFDDLVEEGDSPSYMGNSPGPNTIPPPSNAPSPPPSPNPGPTSGQLPAKNFSVQVANFKNKNSADALKKELADRGYSADVKKVNQGGEEFYKVKVGQYENKQKAEETAKNLQLQHYTGFVQED